MTQPSLLDQAQDQSQAKPKPTSKRLQEFMKGRNPANYMNETDYFPEPSDEVKAFIQAGCDEILDEMNERIDRTIATLTREGNWPYVPGVPRPDTGDDQQVTA